MANTPIIPGVPTPISGDPKCALTLCGKIIVQVRGACTFVRLKGCKLFVQLRGTESFVQVRGAQIFVQPKGT